MNSPRFPPHSAARRKRRNCAPASSQSTRPRRCARRKRSASDLREQRAKFVESLPTVMVMEEMPQPRETFVLMRGEYDKPGEQVDARRAREPAAAARGCAAATGSASRAGWSIRRIR